MRESNWYQYVHKTHDNYAKHKLSPINEILSNSILKEFEELNKKGFFLYTGANKDVVIDQVWNELFYDVYNLGEIKFKIDKSVDEKTALWKIAIQKDTMKLLILNETIFIFNTIFDRNKDEIKESLNNKAYKIDDFNKLAFTRKEITKMLIDGELNEQFMSIPKHIINQLEDLKIRNDAGLDRLISHQTNKIPAKYYALYHWILIDMGIERNFEKDDNDKYKKREIEKFAEEKYSLKDGQGFYRAFTNGTVDITRKTLIRDEFGKGYKKLIITISNNDSKVVAHLKNYPN